MALNYNYISAGAGAGKTEWAINHAKKLNYVGQNVLIIVPTIALANSISQRSKYQITPIHSENGSTSNTVTQLFDMFREQAKTIAQPKTFVTTEASFVLMGSSRLAADRWTIIKDEANEPLAFNAIRCPDSRANIESWFSLRPTQISWFSAVSISALCPKTTTEHDDVYGHVHMLKEYIKNPYTEVLVDVEQLDYDIPLLAYSVFCEPELYEEFNEVYFMSANFDHTFLYQQWAKRGVVWHNKTPQKMLSNPPSQRVRIHYWTEQGSWSATRRHQQNYATKMTNLDSYLAWFTACEPGNDYVYSINLKDQHSVKLSGVAMPAVCHGLNDWNNYTKFMTTASYLIGSHLERVYQYYGSSTTDARGLRNTQMIYQQLMRTDLRNYQSNKPIDLYVPTLTEARELLLYLPEATIMDMCKVKDGDKTGVTGHLNPNWQLQFNDADDSVPLDDKISMGFSVNEYLVTHIELDSQETLHKSAAAMHIAPHDLCKVNLGKRGPKAEGHPFLLFIREIARTSQQHPDAYKLSKEDRAAIKANLPWFATGRQEENTRLLKANQLGNNSILAFDFDGTALTNLQISKIFKNCEWLTYTTTSNDPAADKQYFRLIVPTNRTMTLSEHKRLMDYYSKRIEEYCKKSNLDTTKLTPYSKFFFPHGGADITHKVRNKTLLNVDEVLMNIPKEPVVLPPQFTDLVITYPAGTTNTYQQRKIQECEELIKQLRPGERSTKAVQIAGKMSKLPLTDKQNLYTLIKQRQVDEATLKQVKKYAGL